MLFVGSGSWLSNMRKRARPACPHCSRLEQSVLALQEQLDSSREIRVRDLQRAITDLQIRIAKQSDQIAAQFGQIRGLKRLLARTPKSALRNVTIALRRCGERRDGLALQLRASQEALEQRDQRDRHILQWRILSLMRDSIEIGHCPSPGCDARIASLEDLGIHLRLSHSTPPLSLAKRASLSGE
jgi:hypothetical protein